MNLGHSTLIYFALIDIGYNNHANLYSQENNSY